MLDLKTVVADLPAIEEKLSRRGADAAAALSKVTPLADRRRKLIMETERARALQKQSSERMKDAQQQGPDAVTAVRKELKGTSDRIKAGEEQLKAIEAELEAIMLTLPNIPHDSVPFGKGPDDNPVVRVWGEKPAFNFEPRWHDDLGKALGILDVESAGRVSGARFAFLLGAGARLERALIQFMLDVHSSRGYTEVVPPYLVNRDSVLGTGQLPKFEDDLFRTTSEPPFYLIPTAEVSVTNMHREQILERPLPLRYCAYSPCFRAEAGSYGKDVRGLIRQHQFEKVELVKFARPEESYAELESMVDDATEILRRLGLHHRVVLLCTGDMGFTAAKTYDIEVWLPGQSAFREISSCSNCEDFQARRASIRYRPGPGEKPRFVHTLNGSGLAVGRTLVAILEQCQQADGSVVVPAALRPYMGIERITAP